MNDNIDVCILKFVDQKFILMEVCTSMQEAEKKIFGYSHPQTYIETNWKYSWCD